MFRPASHSGQIRTSVSGALQLWCYFTLSANGHHDRSFYCCLSFIRYFIFILCFDIDSNNSSICYFNYIKQLNKQEIIFLLQLPLQRLLAVLLLHQTLIKS